MVGARGWTRVSHRPAHDHFARRSAALAPARIELVPSPGLGIQDGPAIAERGPTLSAPLSLHRRGTIVQTGNCARMRARISCVFLLLLLGTACREAAAPLPDYRPEEAGTVDHALCLLGFDAVPLREVSSGHHLVQATINGRSGSFVLDTGANVTVVDQDHLAHFGMTAAGGAGGVIGGLGGGRRAAQVSIDSFRLGAVDIRQRRIVAADLGQLLQVLEQVSGTTVYGLVGQDVLTEHRGIVDVARPMLYLIAEDRDPAPVPAGRCRAGSEPMSGG